ncbi:potassium channel family protein [Kribbella sp. NPDC004875]|uniref:potassium channel family protein n=1 Tax=Kribbella sp. NPDC004875 TaxID=3364107 RepID=UPI0036B8E292
MTAGTGVAPYQAAARPSFGRLAWMLLRVTAVAAALVALYYALPLDHASTFAVVTILVVGLVLFIALVTAQVLMILRSPFPGVRAVESLATSLPLFLLLFASAYVVMAARSMSNFGEHLTHSDGLYFTVTVFSTVGFGDITAKSDAARLVVTGQMIADLVVFGVALKVVVGAVQRGRQRRAAPPPEAKGEPADNPR